MGAFDRNFYNILNRYNFIREQSATLTNPQGPKADEFLKRVDAIKQMYAANDPNADTEFQDFTNWYKQNRNDIIGQSGSEPVAAGTATKTSTAGATVGQPTGTPASAPVTASTSSAQPAGEITPQQKEMFKKLHGTSYNPGSTMDKQKMSQMQSAGQEVGYDDVNKLANASYAKQYANSPKGTAYANAAKTNKSATEISSQSQPFTPTQSTQPAAPSQPGAPTIDLNKPINMNLSSPVGVANKTPVYNSIKNQTNSVIAKKPTSTYKTKPTNIS